MPQPQGYHMISSPMAGRMTELREERQVTIDIFRDKILEKITNLQADLPCVEGRRTISGASIHQTNRVLNLLAEEIRTL